MLAVLVLTPVVAFVASLIAMVLGFRKPAKHRAEIVDGNAQMAAFRTRVLSR